MPIPRNKSVKRQFEVIMSLERAFSATDLVSLYEEALDLARAQKSWKGVLAVAESVNDRLVGKPIQMIQRTNSSLADLLMEAREVKEMLAEGDKPQELIEDTSDVMDGQLSTVLERVVVDG